MKVMLIQSQFIMLIVMKIIMSLTLSWVWNIKTLGQKAMGHKPNGLEVRTWKAHYRQTFYSSKKASKHCSMQRFDKKDKT